MLSLAAFAPGADHVRRSFFFYGVFVFVIALWRYAASDVFDPYKCGALLAAGEWLDERTPANWQPPGCKFHSYSTKEANQCLREQHVLFAGDSTVRQLFWQTVITLDPAVSETSEKHSDIRFVKDGLNVEFLWDPYLNSTALRRIANCGKDEDLANAYVVLGGGLWFARYLGDNGVNVWKANTDKVIDAVRACPSYYSLPYVLPVTVPDYAKLNSERSATILRSEVDYMNNYLKWVSQQSNIIVPSALNDMMTKSPHASDASGIHATQSVAKAKADLLLNMRCNQEIMNANGYPFNKTCCYKYPGPNFAQALILLVTVIVLPALYIKSSGILSSPRMWTEGAQANALVTAGFIFATTLTYCYVADRTSLFNKAAKQYSTFDFSVLTLMTVLVGLVTMRKSESEQGFMGRDQSSEWKGWMQIMVLIYHITGASKVLSIYKAIRVMVAAYLFMTGYGHTVYFYKKNDFGLKRVASVLVRLNLLSCALAYIMDTDYLFYYFAPLSSFWFLVVYGTMYVQSHKNGDLKFLLAKIAVSAVVMNAAVSVHGVLEVVWSVLEHVFFISWDLREWRFRVLLDMYIVYVGMLGAILSVKVGELKLLQHPSWPNVRVGVLAGSAASLVLYAFMSEFWSSKVAYNARHAYISVLPILGFLFLRNATKTARNVYSAAYAWVGNCSLETFTLQFHIWMAADTNGILEVVSSRHRVLNLIITTPLFLFVSFVTSEATGVLTSLIVNGIKKPAAAPPAPAPAPALAPEPESESKEVLPVVEPAPSSEPAAAESGPEKAAEPPREFKLLEHPVVEMVGTHLQDMRVRLGALLAVMWALNVGAALR